MALKYSKDWAVMDKNSDKYVPTKERDEKKVREDMQRPFDEIKEWADSLSYATASKEIGVRVQKSEQSDPQDTNVENAFNDVWRNMQGMTLKNISKDSISEEYITPSFRTRLNALENIGANLSESKLNKRCSEFFRGAFSLPSEISLEEALVRILKTVKTHHKTYSQSGVLIVPNGVSKIYVFMIGGGGRGGAKAASPYYTIDALSGKYYYNYPFAMGGNGGSVAYVEISVIPGEQLNVIVGSGGDSSNPSGGISCIKRDSVNLAVARGGEEGASGYSGSIPNIDSKYEIGINPNEATWITGLSPSGAGVCVSKTADSAISGTVGELKTADPRSTAGTTTLSGSGKFVADDSKNVTGGDASGYGAGGGGAVCSASSCKKDTSEAVTHTATGGNGAPGIVMIYI